MVGDVVAAGSGYLYRVQSLFGEALPRPPPDRGRPSPSRAPCGSHVVGGCRSRAGKHVRDLRLVKEDGGGAALDGTGGGKRAEPDARVLAQLSDLRHPLAPTPHAAARSNGRRASSVESFCADCSRRERLAKH
uniref:Uncharacterized protein n=1 Tax=Oryza glumipatula TaxID=40148 RepID=A0A0E0BEF9_9ORYZ